MNAGSPHPPRPRIAIIDTRLPGDNFLVRDLRALLGAGFSLDLHLFDTRGLDPGFRAEVESAGGTVQRIGFPWNPRGLSALLRELATRPLRMGRAVSLLLASAVRSPGEGARALAVLPASLDLAERIRAGGALQAHGMWASVPTTVCLWMKLAAGIPYSFSAHAWDLTTRTRLLPLKVRECRGLVVCSEWGRKRIERLAGEGAPARVVHHGLDLAEWAFRPREAPGNPARVLAVGRLTAVKGFDVLLESCAILRDGSLPFRCDIVGGGAASERARLEAVIETRGLASVVNLAGEVPSAEVRRRMAEADVLVCPFLEDPGARIGSRGIPNVVPEAMALGTPVVATDAGGMRELLRDGETGRVVAQRDPPALARAVLATLEDWSRTRAMARAARELVETRYDTRRTVREFLEATGLAGNSA